MELPLVSVVVVTYNSADFVLETLESIKKQTYQKIEIIISDDKSKDDTIQICNNWIDENIDRFISSKIITTDKNLGIPANCNRGVRESNGEWIKLIAGDDMLLPDALEKYIKFIKLNNNCEIVHAKVIRMIHKNDTIEYIEAEKILETLDEKMQPYEQFRLLKFSSMVKAPSVFIKKELLEILNYFDESIKLCEDWPFWLKLTKAGKKFYFLNEEIVLYRIHDKSVYSSGEKKFIIPPFYSTEEQVYKGYIRNNIGFLEKIIFDYHYGLKKYFFKFNNVSYNNIVSSIYSILNFPYRMYAKFIFLIKKD